jgi:hypothetical protein
MNLTAVILGGDGACCLVRVPRERCSQEVRGHQKHAAGLVLMLGLEMTHVTHVKILISETIVCCCQSSV